MFFHDSASFIRVSNIRVRTKTTATEFVECGESQRRPGIPGSTHSAISNDSYQEYRYQSVRYSRAVWPVEMRWL